MVGREEFSILFAHLALGSLAVVIGGVLASRALREIRQVNEHEREGVKGAGRLIGQVERLLVYLCIVAGKPELLAVLLSLKTIVRYPEVKNSSEPGGNGSFAEYYLVGTMVSVAVAVACGLAGRWLATKLLVGA